MTGPMNKRLLWAVLLGLLVFLGDSVLPRYLGRGGTLLVFAALPLAVGLPILGRAGRLFTLRYAPIAVLLWFALVMWDAVQMPNPPLVGLIPLMAAGISVWTAIAVQANAAWKRARGTGQS
jgi:hypothetical protein